MYRLTVDRFKAFEYVNSNWVVTVEEGTALQDVLREDFFTNVAQQLKPYDEITVRTDDGSWYAKLLVLSAGKTWAKTKVLIEFSLEQEMVIAAMESSVDMNKYAVKYKGPHLKFCVFRRSDNAVIKEQCETREAAMGWLTSFVKAA